MDHQGHGLALQHKVFNEPYETEWTKHETKRDANYEYGTSVRYPDGMPEKYDLYDFEVDKPKGWNVTLVNHEGFFTDVPGFENIAEGHSAKALGSLSLARQGPYFYWGFIFDPGRMTDGAKNTFLNVLYYMNEKRGEKTVEFQ